MNASPARYQEVAADLAAKIVAGQYAEGDKIYARSAVASQYGVSSETARRAMCVLADLGVVENAKGSGVTILSAEKAASFLRNFNDNKSIASIKAELIDSVMRQKDEIKKFMDTLDELVEKVERYREANPFVPFSVEIGPDCTKLGLSLSEINFWHHTSATVVAIKYNDVLTLSPGPYAVLKAGCTVYYIGNMECVGRVNSYLTK